MCTHCACLGHCCSTRPSCRTGACPRRPPSRQSPQRPFFLFLPFLPPDDNSMTALPAGCYLDGLRVLGIDWRVLFK